MPAIITHHLFGEHSSSLLPEGVISTEEERLAFLLGNQGPDPFFFRFLGTPAEISNAHKFGSIMHQDKVAEAFLALRDGVSHLPARDAGIGRAFALGVLSHYALDRAAHPFVYAQERALLHANEELADAPNEVHAVIESDIDSAMLWKERHCTVLECTPAQELAHTERILQVAGALTSQVAWAVFNLTISPTDYANAVKNMEALYRIIEPAGSIRANTVGSLERSARSHSLIQSLSHRVLKSDTCPAVNAEHHAWVNPFTQVESTNSFMDCFDEGLQGWPALALAFTHGGEELRQAIDDKNYSGAPVGVDADDYMN